MTKAAHFEAKKHAYRQTQDGIVISFVVHPNDVAAEMATAPLGTRYMVAFAQIGDEEKPVQKEEKPADYKRVTRVALLCKDTSFQQWVREYINFDNWDDGEQNSKEYILANLKLESRRELATDDDAWQRMLGIIDGFNRWTGRAAELRS